MNENYKEKKIEGYLVIEWPKKGTRAKDIRFLKNKPEFNPREFAIKVNLNLKIPKKEFPEIDTDVKIQRGRVENVDTNEIDFEDEIDNLKGEMKKTITEMLSEVDKISRRVLFLDLKEEPVISGGEEEDLYEELFDEVLFELEGEEFIEYENEDEKEIILSNLQGLEDVVWDENTLERAENIGGEEE